MTIEEFKSKQRAVPTDPGVYRYYDEEGKILYVGKAKNLRKRVASYFTKSHSGRIRLLVKKIASIEYTVVANEADALLLENSLIKEHQPRYNIRLKDDKTYPSICIKKEHFPRVFPTRSIIKDGSEYYGPYSNVRRMKDVLELIRSVIPLRTCTLNLAPEKIALGKYQVCLEYQIGNCLGPCVGYQSEAKYEEGIDVVRNILKGRISKVLKSLGHRMSEAAENLDFEKAARIQKQITSLKDHQSKSAVVNARLDEVDIFSVVKQEDLACVNYLRMNEGAIVMSHNIEIKTRLEEEKPELLLQAIIEMRRIFGRDSDAEILCSIPLGVSADVLDYKVPQRGEKKTLVELSLRNAFQGLSEMMRQRQLQSGLSREEKLLSEMKSDLRLKTLPRFIECIDNSNLQGTDAVAALVVFKNGKPLKKEYRHFNIKTVEGPDDFSSMEEVVLRRYSRMLKENKNLPDLLVVDGGKGQLSSAIKSLKKLGIYERLPVIGIAKNLEELFYPNDPIPLHLDKKSQTLRVIQRMRDEAHRFGITHHRNKRSKRLVGTSLLGIEGIGEKSAKDLLKAFGSVKRVRMASTEELSEVVGKKRAELIRKYFGDATRK